LQLLSKWADSWATLNHEDAPPYIQAEAITKRRSRGRAAILGAVLLGTLALWTLPLAIAGKGGFVAYLGLSDAYYRGARQLFGAASFPRHEFSTVPQGARGVVLAAALYAVIGGSVWVGRAAATAKAVRLA
jgi:hypothetical protein